MTWQSLLDEKIREFVIEHEDHDVAALALKKAPDVAWDYPLVLDQIKARQKAKRKMPLWAESSDIIFPSSYVIEQASSGACAAYKAGLFDGGQHFADLSGGVGIDTQAFASYFKGGICVECDEGNAALIARNLRFLTLTPVKVLTMRAEEYVLDMKPVDLAYIDPQRRDSVLEGGRKGKFRFEDCSPDVLTLLPHLLQNATKVMVKASPMLDIWAGIEALGCIEAVHVIEWRKECREVLYVLNRDAEHMDVEDIPITVVCIDDGGHILHSLTFTRVQERDVDVEYSEPECYFYEPSPAFQKAGCFKVIAERYGVKKMHLSTHLYTSENLVEGFPGRVFEVKGIYNVRAKGLPLKRAHLNVRNFPQSVESLRKKLKLKDGGDDYLFACTFGDEQRALLHGRKPK